MTYYSIRLYPARETLPLPPLQILYLPLGERDPTLLPLSPDPTPPLQERDPTPLPPLQILPPPLPERDPTPLPPSPDPTPPPCESESQGVGRTQKVWYLRGQVHTT